MPDGGRVDGMDGATPRWFKVLGRQALYCRQRLLSLPLGADTMTRPTVFLAFPAAEATGKARGNAFHLTEVGAGTR